MSADFLVELGTEELPPKALRTLSEAFGKGISDGLQQQGITFSGLNNYAAPRRLAVRIEGLAEKAADNEVEAWGPPAAISFDNDGNPTKPALAFVDKNRHLGANLETLREQIKNDGKADKLYLSGTIPGVATTEVIGEIINQALATLPIPKRMRWGNSTSEFVRPVHWCAALYGEQTLALDVLGLTTNNQSRGHRFHAPGELTIESPQSYLDNLRSAKVIADFAERRALIQQQVAELGSQAGGQAIISDDLLDEVTALNEWPVALLGNFDQRFLDVPPEALISSMKEHQKYFHVTDANGKLLPLFITVANIESSAPEKVIAGNEKVIRPRLADAAFFYQTDQKTSQAERRERLKNIVFQAKLGSIYDKTARIAALAEYLAPQVGADAALAKRAGELAKSDLVSEMVLEFDDLQGLMGQYYAQHDGEHAHVAAALNEQYLPRFAGDQLPETAEGTALALADRLDTLVGIFGIGLPPTGSKDPFALRRASLGIIRLLIENNLDIDLRPCLEKAIQGYQGVDLQADTCEQVLTYIIDRFNAFYANTTPETIQAVMAKDLSNPLDIHQRVQAVERFSALAEAKALAAANKRVSNILTKNASAIAPQVEDSLFQETAENQLASALAETSAQVSPLIEQRQYQQAMTSLAVLQAPVDDFFDSVMVMAEDEKVRANRLALLQHLQQLFLQIADISLLAPSK